MNYRELIKDKKKIVVKIGSSSITHESTGNINYRKLEKVYGNCCKKQAENSGHNNLRPEFHSFRRNITNHCHSVLSVHISVFLRKTLFCSINRIRQGILTIPRL